MPNPNQNFAQFFAQQQAKKQGKQGQWQAGPGGPGGQMVLGPPGAGPFGGPANYPSQPGRPGTGAAAAVGPQGVYPLPTPGTPAIGGGAPGGGGGMTTVPPPQTTGPIAGGAGGAAGGGGAAGQVGPPGPDVNDPNNPNANPWQLPGFGGGGPLDQGLIQNNLNKLAGQWALGNTEKIQSLYDQLLQQGVDPQTIDNFITSLGGAPGTTEQPSGYNNPMNWKAMPGFYSQADEGWQGSLATMIKDAYRKEQNQYSLAREGQDELGGFFDQMTDDPLAKQIAASLGTQMSEGTTSPDLGFGMRASEISDWEKAMLDRIEADTAGRGLSGSGDLGGSKQQVMTDAHRMRLQAELQRATEMEAAKERARSAAANWYTSQYGQLGQLKQNIAGLPMGLNPQTLMGAMPNLPSDVFTMSNMNDWVRQQQQGSTMGGILGGLGTIGGSILGGPIGGVIGSAIAGKAGGG
jgi:hypothetical protein